MRKGGLRRLWFTRCSLTRAVGSPINRSKHLRQKGKQRGIGYSSGVPRNGKGAIAHTHQNKKKGLRRLWFTCC